MERKRQLFEIILDRLFDRQKKSLVSMEDDKIVHVPEVIPATQFFLEVMIHPVEVDIGEELRGQITD